eukprot:CAMPEP_0114270458 /NCGR_PEP_ID=MMETSP0058-20121206/27255_1 /TAXON_ID=36894 /ORGANISM="Pyramimonas parkeae, CCMP726" /LENGTH=159 /DNA_ID=CAMNT_0001389209 /DNA_START=467 /DNA_END=943 /DNA_ORIENTATION=-
MILEIAAAHVNARVLFVPQAIHHLVSRAHNLVAEVDEVAYEALGRNLKQRVLEPELLIELPEQVLAEVNHFRVDVLGLVDMELGRALAHLQVALVARGVELEESLLELATHGALGNAHDIRVPGIPGSRTNQKHLRVVLDPSVVFLVVLGLTQQPPPSP